MEKHNALSPTFKGVEWRGSFSELAESNGGLCSVAIEVFARPTLTGVVLFAGGDSTGPGGFGAGRFFRVTRGEFEVDFWKGNSIIEQFKGVKLIIFHLSRLIGHHRRITGLSRWTQCGQMLGTVRLPHRRWQWRSSFLQRSLVRSTGIRGGTTGGEGIRGPAEVTGLGQRGDTAVVRIPRWDSQLEARTRLGTSVGEF